LSCSVELDGPVQPASCSSVTMVYSRTRLIVSFPEL
jgi:hypothetical protein